ncbi:hypothetical protein LWI29_014635 [Acer saccharum]|uniref:Leucine-rich repeat-containing N-terminal plant-type domain-containing protein n=1 Tax=Acer saccharum TaxID=4024 RepID=A0AA39VX70_ACESA|nr:hypothetical protein LWI29_014635 [Acer saccharum]
MEQKNVLLSALGVGVGLGVGLGLASGQTINKWTGNNSASSNGVTAEKMEQELLRQVVEGRESKITFDEFPYYLRLAGFSHHHHTRRSLLTDKATLLAFKSTIISDPNATLANWEETVDVCNFTGVTCNKQRHRVVELNLTSCRLLGQLSHILSNLTGLRYLVLSNNHFYGTIPPELSKLRNLHFLQLDGNNLRGRIPESFAQFSNLTLLFLFENYLTGTLPASFFANCTSLANIDISYNFFTGKIPGEIGNSPGLWNLNLYNNQFTGQVPESLINTSMYSLDLEYNHLSGELPSDIVAKLPSLKNLHLSYNNMVSHDRNTDLDPFFSALGNCTDLDEIELAGMGLGGALPSSIGRLNLSQLLLQENHITGSIPWNIANISRLMTLNLTSNLLNGTIPEEISLLSKLEQLFLSHNLFSGEIPVALGQLSHLGLLDLSHNKFSGEIPASLGNLVRVNSLFLNNNFLSGSIPSTLGQCYDLYRLDLSYNRLTGSIPPEISDDMFGVGISLHKWVRNHYHGRIEKVIDSSLMRSLREQSTEVKRMWDVAIGELMELGILCTQESPSTRPTMLDCADDLDRLKRYLGGDTTATFASSLGISSSTLDDD